MNYARAQLRLTLDDARRALRRDETLSTEIGPLLASLAEEIGKEARTRVVCEMAGQPYSIGTAQARELLMVAREALYNAVHHGSASVIKLRLDFGQDSLDCVVSDDGRGFDAQAVSGRDSGHYGLIGMRERVERMKGAFTVDSRAGGGTRICFTVPCKPIALSRTEVLK